MTRTVKSFPRSKSQKENQNFETESVRILCNLLEGITKVLQRLMANLKTQLPQKLFSNSCTKPDLAERLQSVKHSFQRQSLQSVYSRVKSYIIGP